MMITNTEKIIAVLNMINEMAALIAARTYKHKIPKATVGLVFTKSFNAPCYGNFVSADGSTCIMKASPRSLGKL